MARAESEPMQRSKLQLYSRLKLKNIFPGEWESLYTGDGVEFAASRPFEPGDELRDLDLHTLALSGEEALIERDVGRQMQVMLWADHSAALQSAEAAFFPSRRAIRDHAIGLLACSACGAYSPVGLCAFDSGIRRYFPPRPGESHCAELLDWVAGQEDASPAPPDVPAALAFLLERAAPQSLVFFISDFQNAAFEGDFADLIRPAAKQFDFVPVVIRDPLESMAALPWPALITVTGARESDTLYLTPARLQAIRQASARHLAHLESVFHRAGLDHVVLDSPAIEDCYRTLSGFFEVRHRIRR